jgi:threonine dehydratase
MEKSSEKSETMAFLGQDPVRCKIFVDNECLQQVKNFKYLGCEIAYEYEKDIQ